MSCRRRRTRDCSDSGMISFVFIKGADWSWRGGVGKDQSTIDMNHHLHIEVRGLVTLPATVCIRSGHVR